MALTKINNRSLSGTLTSSQYPIANTNLPAGSVLQTVHTATSAPLVQSGPTTSAGVALMTVNITAQAASSKFLLVSSVQYGSPSDASNLDAYDIHLSFESSIGGNMDPKSTAYNRNTGNAPSGGKMYQTDVPFNPARGDTHTGRYDVMEKTLSTTQTTTAAIGTVITYKLVMWCQTDFYFNRSLHAATNGGSSFLYVQEIKT